MELKYVLYSVTIGTAFILGLYWDYMDCINKITC